MVEKGVRRRHTGTQRQMVHQLGDEERLGGEFFDLLGVVRVVGDGARAGRLACGACAKHTQAENNAEQAAVHREHWEHLRTGCFRTRDYIAETFSTTSAGLLGSGPVSFAMAMWHSRPRLWLS